MINLFTTGILPAPGVVPGDATPLTPGWNPSTISSIVLHLLPSTSINNNDDFPLGSEFEEGVDTSIDLRITNPTGTGPLAVTTPVISAESNCDVVMDPAPDSSVIAGGQTVFTLTITPTTFGAFSFTLTIPNDSPDNNPFVVNFSGTAAALTLGFTPKGQFDADSDVTVADTDKVTSWAGLVDGVSRSFINAGGATRPTLITNDPDFNGHRSISLDGVANYLYENGNSIANAMLAAGTKHCFLVLSIENYVTGRTIFNDGNNLFGLKMDSDPDGLTAFNGDGSTDETPNIAEPAEGTPCLVEILHVGGYLKMKIGAGSYTTPQASGNTAPMGAYFEIGHVAGASLAKMKITLALFHNAEVTGSTLSRARSFLGHKYGVVT